jgi:hypothetical protein
MSASCDGTERFAEVLRQIIALSESKQPEKPEVQATDIGEAVETEDGEQPTEHTTSSA